MCQNSALKWGEETTETPFWWLHNLISPYRPVNEENSLYKYLLIDPSQTLSRPKYVVNNNILFTQCHCRDGRPLLLARPAEKLPPTHWFYIKILAIHEKLPGLQDGLGVLSARPHHFLPGIGRAEGLYFQHWFTRTIEQFEQHKQEIALEIIIWVFIILL